MAEAAINLKLKPREYDIVRETIQSRIDGINEKINEPTKMSKLTVKDRHDLRALAVELTDILKALK